MGSRGKGKILLVGEAPGAQEDVSGEPFQGRAGKLLDAMLANAGLDDVTITNAVRCRPPKNRKPLPGEINACKPWLLEDITAIGPDAIVALGDTALRSLTGRSGIGKYRGQRLALHKSFGLDIPVYCSYHPAYVLRVPTAQATVEADFRGVAQRDREESVVVWKWAEQPPEGDVVALDIETDWDSATKTGGDNVTQIAYASEGGTHVARTLAGVASLPPGGYVTHNGWAFDLPIMRDKTGLALPRGRDTIVLAYLDDETQPLGLEPLCKKYLGVTGWKEGIHAEVGSEEFALYNARDARYTLDLSRCLLSRLGPRVAVADHIIGPAYDALRACSERGIFVNYEAVLHAEEVFTARRLESLGHLNALGIRNPNSPLQVASALGLEGHALPLTDTGKPATGVGVLASLEQTPLVTSLRAYRKAEKALNSFVRTYLAAALSGDGRVHPEYKLWRTVTGRSSASKPNVQQLARDPLLRAFFGAPRDYEFVQADYAAIEFRLAAFVAGCTPILERYAADPFWDPHRWFASILYNVPLDAVTDLQRQIAKSANFGLLYMAQWFTLQEYVMKTTGIFLTENQCKRIRWTWHKAFPEFKEWYARTQRQLETFGFVESLTGRRRHYGDPGVLAGAPLGVREAALREGVNFQVQSLGADVALLGLAAAHQKLLPINGFFHDANSFELKRALTERLLPEIRQAMVEDPVRNLRVHFGVDLTVPLVIEVKTSEEKWLV